MRSISHVNLTKFVTCVKFLVLLRERDEQKKGHSHSHHVYHIFYSQHLIHPFFYSCRYVNKDFRSRFVQILLCSAFTNSNSTKSLNKQLSIRGNNGNYHPANDNYLDQRYRSRHGSDNMNNNSRQNSETNYNYNRGGGSGATLSPNIGRNGSSSSNGRMNSHSSLELLPPITIKSGSTQNLTSEDQSDQ